MSIYQQINLSNNSIVGVPGPVPSNLVGIPDSGLLNLDNFSNPAPPGFADQGFWPVVITPPANFDPTKQVAVNPDPSALVVNTATQTVTGQQTSRAMTDAEYVVANPVPPQVTNFQARAVLVTAGLFANVDNSINSANMAVSNNAIAYQAWNYANFFERKSNFVLGLGAQLNLTSRQVDDLFRQASLIN